MFRLLIGPVIIGALVVLFTYFILPLIISEPGVVSIVAELTLKLSTSFFETLPPIVGDYIANLNLLVAAITVGILVTVVIQLLVLIWGIFSFMVKSIVSLFQRDKKEEEPQDLSPIDMDSSFKASSIGKGVVGRGLDSIDRDSGPSMDD